ncbi:MAG: hypothetical protein IJW26_03750 [Clostridia bacterium]|nr:hypothetical protein [Clostridia bacterium]
MLTFLDLKLKNKILDLFKSVYEIRIRVGKPISVKGFDGNKISTAYINEVVTFQSLENMILNLCNYSLYSAEESLKNGFITSNDGERVGVCGTCVLNGKSVVTVKDFTSLCIRLPRDVHGCSNAYFEKIDSPKSCLVISKPFQGKTTFIRDLGRNYAKTHNVLFIDERDELSAGGSFNLGSNADVIRYSTKKFGFFSGVRSYNPDLIVCDEIMSKEDCDGVEFALLSGVKVIASAHSDNVENLLKKQDISEILKKGFFDDIILLSNFQPKIFKGEQWANSYFA